jgi:LPS sulfotransferase NodH
MKIRRRAVLLFEGRTGSSALADALQQNPHISFLGEDVAHLRDQGWAAQRDWIQTLFWNTAAFSDRRIKAHANTVGFKVKLRDIADTAAFRELLESNQIRILHMTRDNLIKQVVSSIRAIDLYKATGRYNLRPNHAELKPGPCKIRLSRFQDTLAWLEEHVEQLENFVSSLTVPVHHITYEQLQHDARDTVRQVFDFLGVPQATVRLRLIKITDDQLQNVIVNYDELKTYLADTKYARAI